MHNRIFRGLLALIVILAITSLHTVHAQQETAPSVAPSYALVVKGYDWGPGIYKIVLDAGTDIQRISLAKDSFKVLAERHATMFNMTTQQVYEGQESGSRVIKGVYLSDAKGKATSRTVSRYIVIEMDAHPDLAIANPFTFNPQTFMNTDADYTYTIIQQRPLKDVAGRYVMHLTTNSDTPSITMEETVDRFDRTGKYDYKDAVYGDIRLTYASYMPPTSTAKRPLIIWLHGAGEGGIDPRIALLGNRVTALAEEPIQQIFGGAAVLVPQTPTFWMNDGTGYTQDGSSMYADALSALIRDYVERNSSRIDNSRIYIGGGSNGGYMTIKMLLDNPGYFAAAFPAAQAYADAWLTDADIEQLKATPIWFTASANDRAVQAAWTSTPTYKRLMVAGAKDVHYTLFDNVVDLSGTYNKGKGDNSAYEYDGHWSWIYTLNNEVDEDYNGLPVKVNGKTVTLMEWLAHI